MGYYPSLGKRFTLADSQAESFMLIDEKGKIVFRGEQQRVALARALVLKPVILLADEPTGNLDKKNSQQVHDLILELNKELQMTLVVVTHNLELASYMSRCVTVVDGLLVEKSSHL